jgi:outer membrane protein
MKFYVVILILFIMPFSLSAQQEENVWTLQECIDYALENNLTLERSQLSVESSEINYKQAQMAFYPDLSVNGSAGRNWGRSIDPTTNLFVNQQINSANLSGSANLPIFDGFIRQNTLKQNETLYRASQMDFEASRNDVILNIIGFYTNVLFTRELWENAILQLETSRQQEDRTRIQVEAGALPQADLLEIQAQRATNDFNLISRENEYKQAKLQLKLAMQLPPEEEVEIEVPDMEASVDPVMELSAYEIYEIALNNLPEVKSAELNVESSELGIKVAKGGLYPSIGLGASMFTNYSNFTDFRIIRDGTSTPVEQQIGFVESTGEPVIAIVDVPNVSTEDFGFSDQFNENLSTTVTMRINIPIFNRFATRYDIERAKVTNQQALITDRETKYVLWQQIEQAYFDVEAAAKSYASSLLQVEAREEAFRVISRRFEAGASNFVDYQVSETQYFQAQSDLLRAKYDLIFKQKILDFYQGKPLEL